MPRFFLLPLVRIYTYNINMQWVWCGFIFICFILKAKGYKQSAAHMCLEQNKVQQVARLYWPIEGNLVFQIFQAPSGTTADSLNLVQQIDRST